MSIPTSTLARAALLVAALAPACGTAGAPRGAEPAVRASGRLPGGPPSPSAGLPLPSLDVSWSPAVLVAGDLRALAAALGRAPVLQLVAPADLAGGGADAVAVQAALAGLSPASRWLPPAAGSIHDAIVGDALPVAPIDGAASAPAWRPDGVELDPQWLAAAGDPQGAALVVVDRAPIAVEAWSAQPAWWQGGCDAAMEALADGQEHALAELEPFLDHVDAVLLQIQRPALAAIVPTWSSALAEPVERDEPAAEACRAEAAAFVQSLAACAEASPDRAAQACPGAPRAFVRGGLWIGMPAPDRAPSPACAELLGHDYVAAARELAVEAIDASVGSFDARWLALAERLGASTEVATVLEEACAPRRGRLAPADLERARQELAAIGDRLASVPVAMRRSGWQRRVDTVVVPGVGPVEALAAWTEGPGSPSAVAVAAAHALAETLSERTRCRGETDARPWVIAVVDPSRARLDHFTYLYPEQLTCPAL